MPDTTELQDKTTTAEALAAKITIKSDLDYQSAAKFLTTIKGLQKEVKATFKDPKATALAAKRSIDKAEDDHLDPLLAAEGVVKPKLRAWDDKLEAEAAEVQRKANEKARKEAEDRALEAAEAAEARGDTKGADRVLEAPPVVVTPPPPPPPPRAKGISYRETWKAVVTDPHAFLAWVAADKSRIGYVIADQQSLNLQARSMKKNLSIPGVSPVCEKTVSAASR